MHGIEDYIKSRVKLQPENLKDLDLKNYTKPMDPLKIDDTVKVKRNTSKASKEFPVF